MLRFSPVFLTLLVACSTDANHLGNPLLWPVNAVQNGLSNAAYQQQRGTVELIVKSEFPAILADISASGGPVLTRAMAAAGILPQDRPTRIIQLQSDYGLYAANPGALVTALMVFGT